MQKNDVVKVTIEDIGVNGERKSEETSSLFALKLG